jgi:hypothetical protein
MVEILGRPYILFDPEQTEEVKRLERMDDTRNKIINGLNQVLEGIDEVIHEWTLIDREDMQETIKAAIRKLEFYAGVKWYEDLEEEHHRNGMEIIQAEWVK